MNAYKIGQYRYIRFIHVSFYLHKHKYECVIYMFVDPVKIKSSSHSFFKETHRIVIIGTVA